MNQLIQNKRYELPYYLTNTKGAVGETINNILMLSKSQAKFANIIRQYPIGKTQQKQQPTINNNIHNYNVHNQQPNSPKQLNNKHIKDKSNQTNKKQSIHVQTPSLQEQLQNTKQNWINANNRIIQLQRKLQQRDIQIFRLQKLLDEKTSILDSLRQQWSEKRLVSQSVIEDFKGQIEDLMILLSSSNVENIRLEKELKESEYDNEELRIECQRNREELDRVNRINIRLKERYQPDNYLRNEEKELLFKNKTNKQYDQKQKQKGNCIENNAKNVKFSVQALKQETIESDLVLIKQRQEYLQQLSNLIVKQQEKIRLLAIKMEKQKPPIQIVQKSSSSSIQMKKQDIKFRVQKLKNSVGGLKEKLDYLKRM